MEIRNRVEIFDPVTRLDLTRLSVECFETVLRHDLSGNPNHFVA